MRALVRPLVLAAAIAALASPEAGAGADVTLTMQPVARSLRLGDDVALLLTVDNPTRDPVTLPDLRIASDAVTEE